MDRRDRKQLRLIRDYLADEHTPLAKQLPDEVRRWLANAVNARIMRDRRKPADQIGVRAA